MIGFILSNPYHVGINTVEKVIKYGESVYDEPALKFNWPLSLLCPNGKTCLYVMT